MLKFSKIMQAATLTLILGIILSACGSSRPTNNRPVYVERKVIVVPRGPAYGYYRKPHYYRRPPAVVHKHYYRTQPNRGNVYKHPPQRNQNNKERPERLYRPRRN